MVHTATFTQDHWTQMVYHDTVVAKFNQHEIVLNSGGWETATTKKRMNQFSEQHSLDYQVYQTKGQWHVDFKGEEIKFYDNMILVR